MDTLQDKCNCILVGEDEAEVRSYLEMALKCMGYSVELAQDGDEVLSYLESEQSRISAVILDLMMPQRDGFETLKAIRTIDPKLPVIMLSGASSVSNVVNAMKFGATDFLTKPFEHEDLRETITRAMDYKGRAQIAAIPEIRNVTVKGKMACGSSPAMKAILSQMADIGWSDAPVLIQGETGSGKEVLARELHAHSARAEKPFLKLNCAALPSELVESELFGYERGAFTGAFQKKAGMFELANGGSILLDEIGDMDFKLQAKLLQVLQDQEFQRIGGKETVRVDVRVIAATHQDLEKAIAERAFREDLYYRLNVLNFHLPPLRDRREDIIPLAEFLIRKHGGESIPALTPMLKETLLVYSWPGNIRELENVMRRLVVLRDQDMIAREIQMKMARMVAARPAEAALPAEPASVLEQVTKAKHHAEREVILSALDATRWNRKQAAALLKVDYKALLYKMKKLGIDGSKQGTAAIGEPRALEANYTAGV